MNKKYTSIYALALSTLLLWNCDPKVDSFEPSNGEADFSTFVSIGDSYTAGYTDGALGQRGQMESFSYILSEQLAYTGSTGFNQPLIQSDSSVGTTLIAENQYNGYYKLSIVNGSLSPVPTVGDMSIFTDRLYNSEVPFNNFGVPGAKAIHLGYSGYAQANPFFARFASSSTTSMLEDALMTQPTFVSLWIGNNDALGYALAGGDEGSDALTDPTTFNAVLSQIVTTIKGTGSDIIIGNIPDVDDIPYFNYILANGHLPLVIEDASFTGGIRLLVEGEKVLLSASTLLSMGYGQSAEMPLPGEYILDADELTNISEAISSYNTSIKDIATSNGLAYVDLNGLLKGLETGYVVDGVVYTGDFVSGGIFSLDGIHATGRGSAIIANAFIDAINTTFGAKVPKANVNDYPTVEFP